MEERRGEEEEGKRKEGSERRRGQKDERRSGVVDERRRVDEKKMRGEGGEEAGVRGRRKEGRRREQGGGKKEWEVKWERGEGTGEKEQSEKRKGRKGRKGRWLGGNRVTEWGRVVGFGVTEDQICKSISTNCKKFVSMLLVIASSLVHHLKMLDYVNPSRSP